MKRWLKNDVPYGYEIGLLPFGTRMHWEEGFNLMQVDSSTIDSMLGKIQNLGAGTFRTMLFSYLLIFVQGKLIHEIRGHTHKF